MTDHSGLEELFNSNHGDEWKLSEIKSPEGLIKRMTLGVFQPGIDPEYMLYDIGQPMLVCLNNHEVVVGYYAGFTNYDNNYTHFEIRQFMVTQRHSSFLERGSDTLFKNF
ncbi:hypothetical protein HY212_04575 [Candidatus Pacearchaeota archaeon]|nr:hypothetical protein [Candidatus Pacearchaeota archaeon]